MALQFACPHCRAKQTAPESAAGSVHTCTACGGSFNLGLPPTPPPTSVPVAVPEPAPRRRRREYEDEDDDDDRDGFRCPFCRTRRPPVYRSQVSQAGIIVMIVLILFCLPLFWIGLLMKEEGRYCSMCNRKL